MANEEHIQWLLEGVEAWNAWREIDDFTPDLSNADLSDTDLSDANLSYANLSGADLSDTDLSDANLSYANLSSADLSDADLSDADLSGADLSSANLSGTDLPDADLSGANLSDADLSGANLSDADLSSASLSSANLSGARLPGADLSSADLSSANLSGARLPGVDLSSANLSSANLPGAHLPGADLSGANLSDANLSGADLSNATLDTATLTQANLTRANLTDASLFIADLTRVNLTRANLSKTNLENAILNNANLTHTDLSEANLFDADFTKANLMLTDLSRADLTGVEPWLATLYKDDPPITLRQYSIKQTSITSIESLVTRFRNLKKKYSRNSDSEDVVLYFRGETQDEWELRPSVMRDNCAKYESEMLHELMARRPEEFSSMPSALAKWVLAQHHGLKTRFLDITKNPLVALFYACENDENSNSCNGRLHVFTVPRPLIKSFDSDTVRVISNLARLSNEYQGLILGKYSTEKAKTPQRKNLFMASQYRVAMRRFYQLIQEEKPTFEERIDIGDFYRVLIVEPQQSSERVRAQSGAFLVSAFHERFERDEVLQCNPDIPIYAHYSFTISSEHKKSIREELPAMGITRETLFPGLDEAARVVNDSMRRRK